MATVALINRAGRIVDVPEDVAPSLIKAGGHTPLHGTLAPQYEGVPFRSSVYLARDGGLGDVLCLLPAAKLIKYKNPECKVFINTAKQYTGLFAPGEYTDGADSKPHPDAFVFDNEWGMTVEKNAHTQGRTAPYRARAWANRLGLFGASYAPKLHHSNKEIEWAEEAWGDLHPRIAMFASASNPVKQIPARQALALRATLRGVGNLMVLDETTKGKKPYSLRQLSALIKTCDVFVGPDSGPIHMAVGHQSRIVMLPCNTDPNSILQETNRRLVATPNCDKWPCWWDTSCMTPLSPPYSGNDRPFPCVTEWSSADVLPLVNMHLTKAKKICIVMLTWNQVHLTRDAVESLRTFHDVDFLIVDNGSTDSTVAWANYEGHPIVVRPGLGVAEACNVGLEHLLRNTDAEYFFLVNSDVVLCPGYIDLLVLRMESTPWAGLMVGTHVTEERWRYDVGNLLRPFAQEEFWDLVPGDYSATLIRRKAIEEVGFFDPTFKPRYIEDNDYTTRLRLAGWGCCRTSDPFWHLLGAVEKGFNEANRPVEERQFWWDNKKYYELKWGSDCHDFPQRDPVFKQAFNGKRDDPGFVAMRKALK